MYLSYDECIEEADKVFSYIVEILSETAFSFFTNEYISIHHKLFQEIYKHVGRIRNYNVTKKGREGIQKQCFIYINFLKSIVLMKDLEEEKLWNC